MKHWFVTALCGFAASAASVRAQEEEGGGWDCTFSAPATDISAAVDGSLLLRHILHPVDETITLELEWAGASGYLSVGFSPTGGMFPAYAVIGLPDSGDVQKYSMVGYAVTDVTPVATNALTATSIEQTDTTTILRYTQPLNDGVDTVVLSADASSAAPLMVIWAYGITNALGGHAGRGSFALSPGDIPQCVAAAVPVEATPAPTAAVVVETPFPTLATITAEPTAAAAAEIPEDVATTPAPVAVAVAKPTVPTPQAKPTVPTPQAKPTVPTPQAKPTVPTPQAKPTVPTNNNTATGESDAGKPAVSAPAPATGGFFDTTTEQDNATVVDDATESPQEEESAANVTATEAPEMEKVNVTKAATPGLDCAFREDVSLENGELILRQSINPDEQTVTIQMEWLGQAWLSFGWTETGKMVPTTTIIGLPDETDPALAVSKYDMTTYGPDGVVPSDAVRQTLTGTSIVQTDTSTILTFTKPLVEVDEMAVTTEAPMMVMWAWGDTNMLGMHPRRGNLTLSLTECLQVGETAAPTTLSPTVTPTIPPPTMSPTVDTTKTPTVAVSSNATLDCSPQAEPFDISREKDGSLLLKQFILDPIQQTVTVELEWVGEAYLSIGYSKDGMMVPKVAIIGLPDTGEVKKYIMDAKSMEGVYLSPEAEQTLTDASITQIEGVTTLKYTKPLVDEGDEDVSLDGPTRFIWAFGSTNELGMHPDRGDAPFKLQTCLEIGATIAPTVTPVETMTPTAAPVAAAVAPEGAVVDLGNGRIQRFVAVEKDKVEFTIITDSVAGTITVDMVYAGLGYVSFAIGSTIYMPNAISVVASPEINGGVPVKYDLGPTKAMSDVILSPTDRQTLTNHSSFQNETHTGMTFTKLMVEGEEPVVDILGETPFLYAMGSGNDFGMHIIGEAFAINLASLESSITKGSSPNKTLWMVHGILLGLAWAILVPLAIAGSILRGLFTDTTGLWFKTHKNLNTLAIAFTFVGFGIAVYLISIEQKGAKHFRFETMSHHATGLVVFLFGIIQAISGIYRPPGPHKPAPKPDVDDEKSSYSDAFVDVEDDLKKGAQDMVKEGPKDDVHDDHDDHDHSKKSVARIAFEIQHRVIGFVCLILSWITCSTGIDAYNNRFEGTDLTGVLWGIVVGISVATLVLAVYQKIR